MSLKGKLMLNVPLDETVALTDFKTIVNPEHKEDVFGHFQVESLSLVLLNIYSKDVYNLLIEIVYSDENPDLIVDLSNFKKFYSKVVERKILEEEELQDLNKVLEYLEANPDDILDLESWC